MKKVKIGDKAICRGHIKYYGEFEVLEILDNKPTICGFKCRGNYTDYETQEVTEKEKSVFWSKRDKCFRI